ncbi:MAG: bile acid:sodium symporter family protein [Proteobacteria bacterium]|nr:bile acid:sodium symporter family protein [Pseudomonadota bacterium]
MLGVVMFGMGATLKPGDFAAVAKRPGVLALGAALQFGLMPFLAYAIARGLTLPPELLAGLVLVGSAPGGTASNVVCLLARADVALSIALTALSTLLAVALTPLLTDFYAGRTVSVDVLGMIASIARVVLVPVALGMLVNRWWGARLERVVAALPLVSMAVIVLLIAIVVAMNRDRVVALSGPVALAVALHNLAGLGAGYGAARVLGRHEREARTLGIEVGMQNSGLAVVLATLHLGPAAALPGALFSVWHNLSGSALAAFWSGRPPESERAREQ